MKPNGVVLTIFVDDYDAARRFYVDVLDLFEVIADTQTSAETRYLCVALKKHVDKFMIHFKKPISPLSYQSIGRQSGDDVLITLPVDDVESLHDDLSSKGVPVESEIEWLPYGGGFFVFDPFGNKLSLFQRFTSRFTS